MSEFQTRQGKNVKNTAMGGTKYPLPPGPSGLEKWRLIREWLGSKDIVEFMGKLFQVYGPIVRVSEKRYLFCGAQAARFVLLSDPNLIQRAPIAEDGPSTLADKDGEIHKKHKKAVMQAFHPKYLDRYIFMMNELVEQRLKELPTRFNLMEEMRKLTLDITVYTMLGIKINTPEYDAFFSEYWHLVERGKKRAFPFQHKYKRGMQAKENLWRLMRRIRETQEGKEKADFISALQIIAQEEKIMTEEELFGYAYMLTEFGEGDVALMITYSLASLLTRPDLMEQFQKEHVDYSSGSLNLADINNMTFTLNLLREVERFYPPVPFTLRYAAEDLTFMQYRIPKGSILISSIYETHRQPDLFSEPNVFAPSRFESPRAEHNEPFALIGFGGGHHMCVAKMFTQILASVVLHTLNRFYSFQLYGLQSVPEINYRGTAKPALDIMIEISPLNKKEAQ